MALNSCLVRQATPIQIAAGAATQAPVTVAQASVALLAAGSYRYVLIQNRGVTALFWNADGDAATSADFELLPGAYFEFANATFSGGLTGIRASGSAAVVVLSAA